MSGLMAGKTLLLTAAAGRDILSRCGRFLHKKKPRSAESAVSDDFLLGLLSE
jgi:hypothetical protein